ncbi:MAG TPA: response regulator [Polyangiaceae bacterium]|jgi:two-component system chemotaxis sensor kinase CheA
MPEDRYKYFRIEARELVEGLVKGVLELETTSGTDAVVARLLRLAHTLKGAARIVKLASVAQHAHQIEEILEPFRAVKTLVARDRINALLAELDAISSALKRIELVDAPVGANPPAQEQAFETVRVGITEIDAILEGVAEASAHVHALRANGDRLERSRQLIELLLDQLGPRQVARGVSTAALARSYPLLEELKDSLSGVGRDTSARLEQIDAELTQMREAAGKLRLHPVSSLFGALERAARDAAQSLDKSVSFKASGGEIRVDAPVLTAVRDALSHAIRNAVAHGIESDAERERAGKPASGLVELTVERRGNRAAFRCTDDGRGIDVAALRSVAVERGLLSAAQAQGLDVDGVYELLLNGRLSTTRTVSELSGRGIGLNVVREIGQRLNGEVKIESEPGRGTTLEISVPISLASLPVLVVGAAESAAALPLDAIRETFRLPDTEITRTSEGESIVRGGKLIPFRPLGELLDDGRARARAATWSVVVVASASALVALGVDRLQGATTRVVKPLPAWLELDPIVAGASFDVAGNPELVLDPNGLVAAAKTKGTAPPLPTRAARLPVLIIDDSLTTRMLEQSILESAGYAVELATSAEEGLSKAKLKRYGLFLVDVEMPGMSGFEFVTETKRDAGLREIPAILVTSRAAPEDRARGKQVGAYAYVIKGEFDQSYLLKTIRELLG